MTGRPIGKHGVDPQDAVHPDFSLTVSLFPSLTCSYTFVAHERISGETVVVDPIDVIPIIALARAQGWTIGHIFNTHFHACYGNDLIKKATGCIVHGPAIEADRIPGLDVGYKGGEVFNLGKLTGQVLATPGHTAGHLALWFGPAGVLFCGDLLTPLGSGRLRDGTPHEMWCSLYRIRHLPPETLIYSGFECVEANASFALSIDPDNLWLQSRIRRTRNGTGSHKRSPIPSTLEDEQATNPFLRCDDRRIAAAVGLSNASVVDVFTELRKRRDSFTGQPD